METGKIVQFRRGRHIIKEKHMLIEIKKLILRKKLQNILEKMLYESPAGKIIKGKSLDPTEIKAL
jgi:ribosomal protein L35AE/L33A